VVPAVNFTPEAPSGNAAVEVAAESSSIMPTVETLGDPHLSIESQKTTSSENAHGDQTNDAETLQSNPTEASRLRTWGAWAYSYVPALSRATTTPDPAQTTDNSAEAEPSAVLRDLEQLAEDTQIGEAIGVIPSSDAKEEIYNTSTDERLAVETLQGIGVDPAHLSEVPISPQQDKGEKNAATWSLTGLASSAWTWGRGSGNHAPPNPTDLGSSTQKLESGGDASIETEPEAESTARPSDLVEPGYIAGELDLSTVSKDEPIINGFSVTPVDNNELGVSSEPKGGDAGTTAIESDIIHDDAHPAGTTRGPGGIQPDPESDVVNNTDGGSKALDVSQPSRTAWALATASQWIPRRASQTPDSGEEKNNRRDNAFESKAAIGIPCPPKPFKNHIIATNPDPTCVPSSPLAAAQPILLTSEALEARQSPLLPSAASMMAAARPNLVLPSFNHTFRRPPRVKTPSDNPDQASKTEKASQLSPGRPSSPPNMAWRALGRVSQYARGGSRESGQSSDSTKLENRPTTDSRKTVLPCLVSSGKDSWNGVRRVVIIGVHGWFPNAHVQKCVVGSAFPKYHVADLLSSRRRVIGAPRTSSYFASMMGQAVLAQFEADFGVGQEAPEKVTYIPLDGEGTVEVRVDK
jgi:hypothetical protein